MSSTIPNIKPLNQQKNFKERFVLILENILTPKENFEDLIQQPISNLEERKIVQGTIIKKTKSHIIVDINAKNEYSIPISEFQLDKNKAVPEIGDTVEVYIEKIQDKQGKTVLSREKAVREEAWVPIEQAFNENKTVKGIIFGQIKGGLTVDLSGIVAFLPGSQIDVKPVKDVTQIMNIVLDFYVLKMDKKLKNIIVSRKSVIEKEKSGAKDEFYKNIKQGDKLRGTIKNITDYGAFIDIGNVDGLIHITDISWKRINHPSEVLSLNQEVEVIVTGITTTENEGKKISLGIKQVDLAPWEEIKKQFALNKVIETHITNVTEYGIFVSLSDGIEGLVHISQLQWNKVNPKDIKNLYHVNQKVKCMVINIDDNKHRISLSIKHCETKPWEQYIKDYPVGTIIEKPVKAITNFGIFVELAENVIGLIHEFDIDNKNTLKNITASYNQNNQYTVKSTVLGVDSEKGRIRLGIKHTKEHKKDTSDIETST